jgi:hypothetical protein
MKKLFLRLVLLIFVVNTLYSENCNDFKKIAKECNSCNEIFIYLKRGKLIEEFFNNPKKNLKDVYFYDENKNFITITKLKNSYSNWTATNPLVKYSQTWYRSNSGRAYFYINPDTTVQFLEPSPGSGITLEAIDKRTKRNFPHLKIAIKSKYHTYDPKTKKLSDLKTYTHCRFYKPAWCGDGVIDKDQGEECDPKANGFNSENCDESCQLLTSNTYDLALNITVKNPQKIYNQRDIVIFKITVFNQGKLNAKNITIVNYINPSLELSDSKWKIKDNKAFFTINEPIAKGTSKTIYITFKIKKSQNRLGKIVNWAEISQDNGIDRDSIPDSIISNDCHGGDQPTNKKQNVYDTNMNNNLYGRGDQNNNGICEEGEDEDDHDFALIKVK